MLNTKGMLAKLFSAVLALGMVIQPVTPLESPIIVFAQDEEVDPNPDTTPAPSSTQDTGDTPETTPSPTPVPSQYEPGNIEVGGETPSTNVSENTEDPTPRTPDPELEILYFDLDIASNKITLTSNETTMQYFYQNYYDFTLQLNATQVTYDENGPTTTNITDQFTLSEDGNYLNFEYKPTIENNEYAELNNLSLTVLGRDDDIQDNYHVAFNNETTLDGKSLYVDKRVASFTYANQNKQVIVTITNPLRDHTYNATLTKANVSRAVPESVTGSVSIENYKKTEQIILNTVEFEGEYTLSVQDGDKPLEDPVGLPLMLNFDNTGPEVTKIEISNNSSLVTVTLNEEVGANDDGIPNIYLNLKRAADGTEDWQVVSVPGERSADTSVIAYKFNISDDQYGDINEAIGNGTQYKLYKENLIKGTDQIGNPISIGTTNIPELSFERDDYAPVISNLKYSVDDDVTNQPVTLYVSFKEGELPEDGKVNLDYYIDTELKTGVLLNKSEKADAFGNPYYTYIFDASKGDQQKITVDKLYATDGKNEITYDDSNFDYKKEFTIDKLSPELTVGEPTYKGNSYTDASGNKYVAKEATVSIPLTVTEPVNLTVNNGQDKITEIKSDDFVQQDGEYQYTLIINSEAYDTFDFDLSFSGTDLAGNTIEFSEESLEKIKFAYDNSAPTITLESIKVDGEEADTADDKTWLYGNETLVYTFVVSDDGSGVNLDTFDVYYNSDIKIEGVTHEDNTFSVTVNPDLKFESITATIRDNVNNEGNVQFGRPTVIEDDAPSVNNVESSDFKTDVDGNQYYEVNFNVEDYPEDAFSGIASIKYWISRAEDASDKPEAVLFNNGTEDGKKFVYFTVNTEENADPINAVSSEQKGPIIVKLANASANDGTYILHIDMTDNSGNEATYEVNGLSFEYTAPEIHIQSGRDLQTPEKLHDFTVQVTDTGDENSYLSGIQMVKYWLEDGTGKTVLPDDEREAYVLYSAEDGVIETKIDETINEFGNVSLNGTYTLHVTAVDARGNGGFEEADPNNKQGHVTATLVFDNKAADLKLDTGNTGTTPKKKHSIDFVATDNTEEGENTASGILEIAYYLTEDAAEDPTAHVKFNNGVADDYEFKFTCDIPADQIGPVSINNSIIVKPAEGFDLNGEYTLHASVTDKAGNKLENIMTSLYFDNTVPAITIDNGSDLIVPAKSHDVYFTAIDYPADTPSGFASITYWLTDPRENNAKVTFSNNGGEPKSVYTYPVENNPFRVNPDGTEGNLYAPIQINSTDLDGTYDFHIEVVDAAKNEPVSATTEICIDNTPLDVDITYTPNASYHFYDEDHEIFTNQDVQVEVTISDNFPLVVEDGERGVASYVMTQLSNGEVERSGDDFTFEVADDKLSATATFNISNNRSAAVLETIRNQLKFVGSDYAGNGSIVQEIYNDTNTENTIGDTEKSIAQNEEYNSNYAMIIDMVNPTYTMDVVNPIVDGNPVEGSVYNNRVYYGKNTVSQLTPSVSIVEGNFLESDYQVAIAYNAGTDTDQYEVLDVTALAENDWENVTGFETAYEASNLSDGVYRFAVRGTDKAGNLLVPSEDEKTHVNELATSLVSDTDNTYWTNVKVVDTQLSVNLQIKKDANGNSYLTYTNANGNESVYIEKPADIYRQENVAYVIADAVDEKSQYRMEFALDSTTQNALAFANEDFGRNNLNTGSSISGNQRFKVANGYIVDRAGNRLDFNQVTGNYIYLDTKEPIASDVERPTASIQASATSDITARTPDGQDLYAGDVRLDFTITDPNQSEAEPTSSGLREVHYVVKADGVEVAGNVLHKSDFNNATTYTWSGYTVVGSDTNNISVELWGIDNSGNESNHATYKFGIDKTAPVITVTYDNNDASHDKYFKANRTATVTIQDRNIDFSKIHVETSVGHSGLSAATPNGSGVGNNDTRTFTIPYTEDGDYTLQISGTDAVNHEATVNYEGVATQDFTIDKTTPVINVSFNNNDVRNGKYYNAARVATVTIDEHNFLADEVTIDQTASIQRGSTGAPSPSGFGTSGDTHTATINYAADGNYTLTVSYTDMAGNEAEQVVVPEFTIDTTKPVVRFDENTVTDNMATNDVIAPSVIFDDTNFDANGINVTLTGARVDNHNHPFTRTITQFGSVVTFSDFARVKESDDIYTARATITDLAGNTAEATVRFSVNRFGSTFDFNDDVPTMDLVDNYYAQETENVIIREVNVNRLTGYTLTVNRDGSNITLVEGEDFRVISSSIAGGYQYIYEIFPDVFTSEGTYSIIVQSVDEAGNTNTNSTVRTDDGVNDYPVVFAIDKTLPTVSIDELDPEDRSNNNFNENTKTFRISVRDNNAMSRVVVTVDGNVVFDMDGQELAGYLEEHGGFVEITLDAASGYQTIKVQAFDGAGNESADTQYQVLVTTNFFVRFFYNKPLFYGSIIFLILLLLAIAYYIKKRMDKQKKNA